MVRIEQGRAIPDSERPGLSNAGCLVAFRLRDGEG
jgi:hypothetical protein